MKQPQVRERDLVNSALAISAATLYWQDCLIDEDSQRLMDLEVKVGQMLKLVRRFRKEQLA